MVRLAPSSINRQHWRVIVDDNRAHFYMKRQKAPSGGSIDMPKIDMGIALAHLYVANQKDFRFFRAENAPVMPEHDYIGSVTL